MPIYDPTRIDLSLNRAPLKQGDLIIQFDIEFPTSLDEDTKNGLVNILAWIIHILLKIQKFNSKNF